MKVKIEQKTIYTIEMLPHEYKNLKCLLKEYVESNAKILNEDIPWGADEILNALTET